MIISRLKKYHSSARGDNDSDFQCRMIWLSVLELANKEASGRFACDYNGRGGDKRKEQLKSQARYWLTSDDKEFRWVCHMAGLNGDITLKFFRERYGESEKNYSGTTLQTPEEIDG